MMSIQRVFHSINLLQNFYYYIYVNINHFRPSRLTNCHEIECTRCPLYRLLYAICTIEKDIKLVNYVC